MTVALTYESGRPALAARADLLDKLRERIDVAEETLTEADAGNTPSALLFHLERQLGAIDAEPVAVDNSLAVLRSAGARGEAEAIGIEVAKLIAAGADPAEIVVVTRDPRRRGPLLSSVLRSYGIAAGAGGGAAGRRHHGRRNAAGAAGGRASAAAAPPTCCASSVARPESGQRPSTGSSGRCAGAGCRPRRRRSSSGGRRVASSPQDLARVVEAGGESGAALAAAVGRLATTMASRPLRDGGEGALPGPGEGAELRAASAIAEACAELAELGELAPSPEHLAAAIRALDFRVWSGPVAGRVRIADPYRLRASRFDHVFVASLQDGEFPRRDRGGDPFLSEGQRQALGLEPRRDSEAEERYLFYTCISLARRRLFLSYRDCDENGAAEARSPLLDELLGLLEGPGEAEPDAVERAIAKTRDLTRVVASLAEAPSADELARAIAAQGRGADAASAER